ncbi:type II toxin-antitoxin system PemK/MazF family toxin [Dolichospermum sp. LEGE 00240]|jgi:mRNA interferase MazF|uniref:type II toxin-antitoxin system PemK/MazF family toxin n=1 Tax=Dolichospermum sp. LEGE 00240 TaxID=1828603 RepID=UPI001882A665|nr:type II toxin-antitoxin system PemK/MazF family toxin [Dolichospermum sp. LEGE 00240]MDM3847327.1 type II toxin-antitoxin system PemK/MazF family toxin [Aphanizomenon gracile PMC638.10]MDM3851402.1 type II toxin-antitoxin system PemK/MazF family toxin [Aphanizomenon gracile PMC627.10]MDM3853477.1 type II toxin-antitoxin system PemK/MazF family toxin [Aphanizomenon gracile PMC649.10]MDM3859398.1 type II toxin-antitoxin system PemK/MazF family toxin [Aphanizomenon gracile PMC644.10]MBE9248987
MKPGDIVLIRFPQADLKSGKLRPALVIAIAPGRHRDLLLALISSCLHQATVGFDEIINTSDSDYITTGLKVASLIRLGRLTSVESSVINARLGNISPERLILIKNLLINWLRK